MSKTEGGATAIGIILGVVAFAIAMMLLTVQVFVWNINDIIANGANFWNVFWLLLFGATLFGGTGVASRG